MQPSRLRRNICSDMYCICPKLVLWDRVLTPTSSHVLRVCETSSDSLNHGDTHTIPHIETLQPNDHSRGECNRNGLGPSWHQAWYCYWSSVLRIDRRYRYSCFLCDQTKEPCAGSESTAPDHKERVDGCRSRTAGESLVFYVRLVTTAANTTTAAC